MEMSQNLRGMRVIAFDNAALRVRDEDGVIVGEISLESGFHDLSNLAPLANLGSIEAANIYVVNQSRGRVMTFKSDTRTQTAAAAEYQMPALKQQEFELRRLMKGIVKEQVAKERKAWESAVTGDTQREPDVIEQQEETADETVVDATEELSSDA